ncbi:MAG: hypothetical protein ACYC77_03865 [Coriobacteriia bacterium]
MSRFTKIVASVVLGALLLGGVVGCVDQTADANAAIEAANVQAQAYSALDSEITALMDEAGAVDFTPEGVVAGIASIDAATAKFEERTAVIAAIKAEFAKIADMDVDETIKTYAAQQVEVADLLAQMDALGITMLADTKSLYELIKSGSTDTVKAEELSAAVEATAAQLEELDAQVTEKQAASDKYFEDNRLGGE